MKTSLKQFREMEKIHSEGNLIKICKRCGDLYKPELRTYNKKTWKLKEVPNIKIQKNGKLKIDKYVKNKKVVGNWFLSKYCDNCLRIIGKDRIIYKKKIIENQKLNLLKNNK